jgi:tryptophan synthase beta chain
MSALPDEHGHFGRFGGRFMPEALIAAHDELTAAWQDAMADPEFTAEFQRMLREYAGTPSLLYDATKLSEVAGARILLKREDLNHTGAHKIRNVLGQALLTKRMGKTRVIAETGAGQHGVATATACAYLGLDCVIYMGEVDTERQALNVARMHLLGAEVIAVRSGSRTLKDAINEALRDWVASVDDTHYMLGTAAGSHPFPAMVRDFCRGIGDETRVQCEELIGRLPDAVAACVGGGSNAIGMFETFIEEPSVRLYGFEAAGDGVDTSRHAATIWAHEVGVLHGARTYVLQDEDGQTVESHSISAGLDYPGVGPEHAWLADTGRAEYRPITDAQAMDAMALLARTEGIIPAIESAHAIAGALGLAEELGPDAVIVVNLSGRGDKDMGTAIEWFGLGAAKPDDDAGAGPAGSAGEGSGEVQL